MRVALVAVMSCVGIGLAQAQPVEDAPVTTTAGKEVRLGAFAVFKRDCSGGTAAEIRPAGDQKGGVLAVTSGTLSTSRVPGCATVSSPARIITYRPNPGFTGSDRVTFDVVGNAAGGGQTHTVSVTVTP